MAGYILAGSCLAALFLFLWAGPSKIVYVKRLAVPVICLVFIACLVAFSKTAVAAASRGISLWFDIVFPSLFPFFAASEIINATGFIKAAGILLEPVMRPLFNVPGSGSFALLMGVTSGYPVGAKITCDLRKKGLVSKIEGERLLAFTNNSGPLFIVGAVATGMYGSPNLGVFLLACHILACLTVGLSFRYYKKEKANIIDKNMNKGNSVKRFGYELLASQNRGIDAGVLFGDAIKNSVSLILAIGGYIVLFSVIISLLLETGLIGYVSSLISSVLSPAGIRYELITAVLSGFFEITNGSRMASTVMGVPIEQQLAAASLIIGWAGLSVHSQVYSIVNSTDISIKPYLLGKMLQGAFAAAYAWLGFKIFKPLVYQPQPVLNTIYPPPCKWFETLFSSCSYLLFILIVFGLFLSAGTLIMHRRKRAL